jgi:hypothetical protein
MTSQVSQALTVQAQAVNVPVSADGVRPGEQVAVSSNLSWQAWVPLAYQVSWTELQFFNPASQPPRAGVTMVEMPWPGGQPAQASWPHAPAGWRVAASNQAGGWVLWRKALPGRSVLTIRTARVSRAKYHVGHGTDLNASSRRWRPPWLLWRQAFTPALN